MKVFIALVLLVGIGLLAMQAISVLSAVGPWALPVVVLAMCIPKSP